MAGYKLRVIREKLETTYETDANPAAVDAVLCRNLTMKPIDGDWRRQEFVRGTEGAQPEDLDNPFASAEYEVEAATSGTAGTPPAYAAILKSSGLTEVATANTSVAYSLTPRGGVFGSTTLHMLNGVIAQKVLGCRGSFGFTAETGQRAFWRFSRRGRYGVPAAFAKTSHPFADWTRGLLCTPENMFAFTLGGTKLCVRSFSLTDGRQPQVDKYMNCGGTDLGDRNVTGRMTVKWPDLAAKDLITATKEGTVERLVFELGKTAGSKLRISGPKVQIKFSGEENVDGDLGASIDLVFQPDQGDDELLIEFL